MEEKDLKYFCDGMSEFFQKVNGECVSRVLLQRDFQSKKGTIYRRRNKLR